MTMAVTMSTKSIYSASNEFAIGFIAGATYTANAIGAISSHFTSIHPGKILYDDYYEVTDREDVRLTRITNGTIELELNWPLTVNIEREGNIYLASNIDFNIHEIGESKDEVIQEFQASFIHFWDYYKDIDDNQLIGFAKRLKALFSGIVKNN